MQFAAQQLKLNVPVALTEALSNAILYGNAEDPGKRVRVNARIDRVRLVVEVIDEGVGFDIGLFDQTEVNGVVLTILVTCLIGPWVVQRYGRKVAIQEEQRQYAEDNLRNAEMALQNFQVNTITLPSDDAAAFEPGVQITRDPVFTGYFQLRVENEQLQPPLPFEAAEDDELVEAK